MSPQQNKIKFLAPSCSTMIIRIKEKAVVCTVSTVVMLFCIFFCLFMLSSNFVDEVIYNSVPSTSKNVRFCLVMDMWLATNCMLHVLSSLWFDNVSFVMCAQMQRHVMIVWLVMEIFGFCHELFWINYSNICQNLIMASTLFKALVGSERHWDPFLVVTVCGS